MKTQTILLVGVGGQGTILAGDLLAGCAAEEGYDVKISEIHGMSQRGGSVTTVVRFGDCVHSMICDEGCADYLVSFEAVEALRAKHYLRESGKAFVNTHIITPVSVHIGNYTMPSDKTIQVHLNDMNACSIDASKFALDAGTPKSTNVVLMGAISNYLPFKIETWQKVISNRVPKKTINKNLTAFMCGREEANI